MKKFVSIIISLFLFLCMTQCQKERENLMPKKLTLNLQEGDLPSLHPAVGIDLRSRCLFLALYEPLMRRNGKGSLTMAAAEKVELDPTQTIYTFHIRAQKWSNGEPVTSHHFANAWKYALNPKSLCVRADLFYPIKNAEKVKRGDLPISALGVSTPDERTLVVELEHPTPYFLDLTATSFFSPLYNANEKEPENFNGPFVLGERLPDQKLYFNKNKHYWDASSTQIDQLCFTMVRDPMTALALYEKGELDLVGDPFSSLPFDIIPTLQKRDELSSKVISRIFYLLLNSESYPFQNASLRKALSLSIDRKELTSHLFFGELPTALALPKTLSLCDETEFENTTDAAVVHFEKALKELNLTRETFPKIIFNYAELSGQKKLGEFLQDEWKKKLGIKIDLVCSEWNVHIGLIRKGNYQMGTLHLTTLYQDPMFYFDLFRDKKSLCNYARWENPQFQELLNASERATNEALRKKCLVAAEKLLFEEMPVIPLFTQNLQFLVHEGVNLEITDLGIYDFKSTTVPVKAIR